MRLQVLSTNFGVDPADVQLDVYQNNDVTVINGDFVVDTTNEDYKMAFALEIAVSGLNCPKSMNTTVFVMNANGGTHDITITKARIKTKENNQRIICVRPVRAYDSLGMYRVVFRSMFAQPNVAFTPQFQGFDSITPEVIAGAMTGAELYLHSQSNWLMLVMKVTSLTFDASQNHVQATLPGFPSSANTNFPLIFTEELWSETGSKYYPAFIENGVLTILKDGNGEETNSPVKFARAFILR